MKRGERIGLKVSFSVKEGVNSLYQDLTNQFVSLLQLKHRPIGLAFVDIVPENVQHTAKHVPSACTFWRLAEQGVFYANAEDHQESDWHDDDGLYYA
jgi:uncharacterized protein (DUF169 family)